MCKAMEEMCAEVAAKVKAETTAKYATIAEQTLRESGVSEDIIQLTVSRILNSHKNGDSDEVQKEQ